MDFKNVPKEYRPIPFWSWNEKLNTEETREQIRKMDEAGIGGFFMHARGGLQTEYMGDEWFDNVGASADEAEKTGMHAWAYDENGWPSGFGGGKVNGKGLDYQQKYLRYKEGEDPDQEHLIVNKDGYCFYYDVNPFYVDTLDLEVTQDFINEIYEPYYEKFGNKLEGFFTDEPQISRNGIPWSFKLPAEYKNKYGEDILDRLIELYKPIGNYKQTRIKFWKLVTDLFSAHFMKPIYDWCVAHNYQFTGHLVLEEDFVCQIVSNGACMPHYEYFTMPGMDWLGRHNHKVLTQHQLKSAARQLGKKQVLSETFACCGHNVGHDELKWIYEYQMVNGVTVLCQHLEGYSNRGLRKRDYPPAMYIQQPWWKDYKMFNDAMSRTGMVLTGGDDCVDVLVLHPQTTVWSMFDCTDDKPIHEYHRRYMDMLLRLEAKHINFHLGDETLIERHGKVEGKEFIIGEKRYSKVIIPEHEFFLENTEKLLAEYKANGGIVTTGEELAFNDVIDIPEITYCQRKFDDHDVYFFVNSTEGTYDATIKVGNKVLDPVTGELYDFSGKHTFKKYESLLVIDDRKGRAVVPEKKALKPVDLSGKWNIDAVTENSITLDYCDYYFDGVLEEKNGYILNAMYRAIDRIKRTHITCEYTIEATYKPENIFLCCEMPHLFDIKVNGESIDKTDCGYFRDKSFRKIDIAKYFKVGENKIVMDIDFEQSAEVYANIEKGKRFESEKNKLTFDIELEQIYLVGDFSVATPGEFKPMPRNSTYYEGSFVIAEPKKEITLVNIEQQGFPGFAGDITVSKKFNAEDTAMMLDFVKTGINVIKAKVNGKEVETFMWEPFTADISEYLVKGENTLQLTLVNNLRNMQGPFHLPIGEEYGVGPGSFYKERCVWSGGYKDWNDNRSIVDVTLKNR